MDIAGGADRRRPCSGDAGKVITCGRGLESTQDGVKVWMHCIAHSSRVMLVDVLEGLTA